jgi:hypothetical protein
MRLFAPATFSTILGLLRTLRSGSARRREAIVAKTPLPYPETNLEPRARAPVRSLAGQWVWGCLAIAILLLVLSAWRSSAPGGDDSPRRMPQEASANPAGGQAHDEAQRTTVRSSKDEDSVGHSRSGSGVPRQSIGGVPGQPGPRLEGSYGTTPTRTIRPQPPPAPSVTVPRQPPSPATPSAAPQTPGKPAGTPGNGPVGAHGPDGTGAPGQAR